MRTSRVHRRLAAHVAAVSATSLLSCGAVAATQAGTAAAASHTGGARAAAGVSLRSIKQRCVTVTVNGKRVTFDRVTVTAASGRKHAAATVSFEYNLNSADGSYQGPASQFAVGHFTKKRGTATATLRLPQPAYPVLGLSAAAVWADGRPTSYALDYKKILACWG